MSAEKLDILYQDRVILVCIKPARVLSTDEPGGLPSLVREALANPIGSVPLSELARDKKNIVIDGNGATVLVHGKMTPMIFDNCENVTVRNIVFDYACPTMTEFTVLSDDGESVVIRINSDCLFRVENNELIWHGEEKSDGGYYWENKSFERGRRKIS